MEQTDVLFKGDELEQKKKLDEKKKENNEHDKSYDENERQKLSPRVIEERSFR